MIDYPQFARMLTNAHDRGEHAARHAACPPCLTLRQAQGERSISGEGRTAVALAEISGFMHRSVSTGAAVATPASPGFIGRASGSVAVASTVPAEEDFRDCAWPGGCKRIAKHDHEGHWYCYVHWKGTSGGGPGIAVATSVPAQEEAAGV